MGLKSAKLNHVAISCKSLEESIDFYTKTLGFQIREDDSNLNVKVAIDNFTFIELFPFDQYKAGGRGNIPHFAIAIESLEESLDYLSTKNIFPVRGPFHIKSKDLQNTIRSVAFITGPDLEEIELVQNY
ncbi:VOC family protein [Aureivirga sp. CE67]|uniref:VOC family protein n=1 Tax=Aureivirga sp. CE67 TaxID=1788983 RepID=UPI0018CBC3F5|nr:VOC family protein [Aureivirga sp. CE67]